MNLLQWNRSFIVIVDWLRGDDVHIAQLHCFHRHHVWKINLQLIYLFYTFYSSNLDFTNLSFACGDFCCWSQKLFSFILYLFIPSVCLLSSLHEISLVIFHHIRLEWKAIENWENWTLNVAKQYSSFRLRLRLVEFESRERRENETWNERKSSAARFWISTSFYSVEVEAVKGEKKVEESWKQRQNEKLWKQLETRVNIFHCFQPFDEFSEHFLLLANIILSFFSFLFTYLFPSCSLEALSKLKREFSAINFPLPP